LAPAVSSAQCTTATPAGSWGFIIQGFAPPSTETLYPELKPARPEGFFLEGIVGINPFALVGTITFDGQGHWTATFVYGGRDTVSGTYTVNPNCSLSLYGLPFSPLEGVFINGLTEFYLVVGQGGNVGTGSGAKISGGAPNCTNASLVGTWGYNLQGNYGPQELTFATVGTLTFDGAGHLTGPVTWVDYGNISFLTGLTGTYSVNADCSFTMQLDGLPGPNYFGALTTGSTRFYVIEEGGDSIFGLGQKQ